MLGCISTYQVDPDPFKAPLQEELAASLLCHSMLWQNRSSTGYILLAVPRKALKYEALEWILKFKDYKNMPMILSASKFVQASGNKAVEELEAVEAVFIVLVSTVRSGLFLCGDAVDKLQEVTWDFVPWVLPLEKRFPAGAVFDNERLLGYYSKICFNNNGDDASKVAENYFLQAENQAQMKELSTRDAKIPS
ncbi:hypothetical protein SELMODRAFT_415581 [Selaginella moellendorffii]|uniref:Uncharacterized protein n=1 Tax=Selaginella moellendorffii TaxID=88036 RepID=D8RWK8_SELML|nr:hypothetical protein SELMODRAFT_415581 [Selaginella moellendorffii]